MSTRSGTNELHGSIFWGNRNSKLSTRWSFVAGAEDINNTNFGRLTAADPSGANQADNTVANRRFTVNLRLNF